MISLKGQKILLHTAFESIHLGLESNKPLPTRVDDFDLELQVEKASFVTLHLEGQLRGCIGVLEAFRPLIMDVSANAFSAAFHDSRFNPLQHFELDQLQIHISILSSPEKIKVESEEDLLNQLKPNWHGVILREGDHKSTFLPSVWAQLPDKKAFLSHLKQKAGLPANYWSPTLEFEIYTVEEFGTDTYANDLLNSSH